MSDAPQDHETLRPATLAVHGGRRPSPKDPDVAPPLRRTSTFLQHEGTHASTDAGDWSTPLVYSRYKNPGVEDCEVRLARLEGAERAVLFASGMAAIHAVVRAAIPGSGGRVAMARQIYGGSVALFEGVLAEQGVTLDPFDVDCEDELAACLDRGAALVHVEGISNPVARVADLRRIARQAHAAGAALSVDSTFASPIVQRPLVGAPRGAAVPPPEERADYVVHSATKALGGHSDLTAGVVLGSADLMGPVLHRRKVAGAILDPAAAWLLTRSLATVDLRVRAQCRSAMGIAEALRGVPGVAHVHYPGLASDPSHARALELLEPGLFGSVLAFELEGGDAFTRDLVGHLRLALDAPSLGGVETLVSIPAFMSHVGMSPEERRAAGVGPGCVRVAAGIEDPVDLAADFLAALAASRAAAASG